MLFKCYDFFMKSLFTYFVVYWIIHYRAITLFSIYVTWVVTVTGCSGYTASGAQVVTAGDIASATCRATGETWKMTCVDSEWTGNELKCGKN